MASLDDIALPDANLNPAGLDTSTNQGKFTNLWTLSRDVWWRLCSKTGLSKLIAAFSDGVLNRAFPKLGPDWKPTKDVSTIGIELGAFPQNVANIRGDVAGLARQLAAVQAQLTAVQGQLAGLSAPALTDAQAAALAQQIAAALPAAPTTGEILAAIKGQWGK